MGKQLRYAWTMKLKPGCAGAYTERHAAVWPEMRATLDRAGYRNYTIFLRDDLIVGYFECDDLDRLKQVLAADEAAARWRVSMAALVDNKPDPDTGFLPLMTPVFHHTGEAAPQ